MRGARIAAAGLALTALIAGVGLLASWLAAEREPVEAGPQAGAMPATIASTTPLLETSSSGRLVAETELADPSRPPAEARPCQDLAAVLKEVCDLLAQPEGALPLYIEPLLWSRGNRLDAHCASILSGWAADSTRPKLERLAALGVLRLVPTSVPVAKLGDVERATLWSLFDLDQPDDLLANRGGLESDEVEPHHEGIARLAGSCLVVLGGQEDSVRLVDALCGKGPQANVALRAFDGVRSASAADALLNGLGQRTRSLPKLAYAVERYLNQEEIELDPLLRERAAQALSGRWRAGDLDGTEVPVVARILDRLDPSLAAKRWGEIQDEGGLGPFADQAANSWARSASVADLSRLDRWLEQGAVSERLSAARAVLLHAQEGRSAVDLSSKAADTLDELMRTCPDPNVRREALYGAKLRPESLASMVSRGLKDEDPGVRRAAAWTARSLVKSDAALRTQVERAAASDDSELVRKVASQALR